MTLKQQRVEVAKLMGWTNIRYFEGALIGMPPRKPSVSVAGQLAMVREQSIPYYCSDLNAIQSALMTITDKTLQNCFIGDLENIIVRVPGRNLWSWGLVTSTAAEQAEAFLRTSDKWP